MTQRPERPLDRHPSDVGLPDAPRSDRHHEVELPQVRHVPGPRRGAGHPECGLGARCAGARSSGWGGADTCPMHPEIIGDGPGSCPKCGMFLVPADEPVTDSADPVPDALAPAPRAGAGQYTCPMHPEIIGDGPGSCPLCGMHLEPVIPDGDDESAVWEYRNMRNRFLVSLPFSVALLSITIFGFPSLDPRVATYVEFALATPVVLYCAWPFFVRFVASVRNRAPNMWTLIGLGVGAAYAYSVIAVLASEMFPEAFDDDGQVPVYFEAAAVIVLAHPARAGAGAARPRLDRRRGSRACSTWRPRPRGGSARTAARRMWSSRRSPSAT